MAKVKTSPYGLKPGHPMSFRRTIRTVKKPYQLVFQPGTPLQLTDSEVAGLKKEIDGGLIVRWDVSANDHRDRPRPLREPPPEPPIVAEAATDELYGSHDDVTEIDEE